MRNSMRIFVVTAMALAAAGLATLPGTAGTTPDNTVTVVKQVTGDVPAGTTFTVEVTCGALAAAVTPVDITFDAAGNPTTNNTVTTPAGSQCTIQETVNGGATSTTYACDMVRGQADQSPPYLGTCDSDHEVSFNDVIGDAATITVTNNFPTAPPVQPITPAAQAVQAPPVFTG